VVVGWYHSHPGFGCWLSMVDVKTQKSFEQLSDRAVAVVIDPVRSVKGRVEMDVFRSVHPNIMATGQEPRITTSNIYHLKEKPERMSRLRGLGKLYYNMVIAAKTTDENEINMLKRFQECTTSWAEALKIDEDYVD